MPKPPTVCYLGHRGNRKSRPRSCLWSLALGLLMSFHLLSAWARSRALKYFGPESNHEIELKEASCMEKKHRVVIADHHPIFRRGLRQFICDYSDFDVSGEAGDEQAAMNLIHSLKPDLAIVDVCTPGIDGLRLARRVQVEKGPTLFIVLTGGRDERAFNEAIELGVKGYILKEDDPDYILQSLRAVSNGRSFISPTISDLLVNQRHRRHTLVRSKPALARLTRTERRVLRLIAQNKTSKMIARELFISPSTVETHRCNISSKLELRGTHPVLRFALEHMYDL
jgi:DNA-binding NarL/FixJ family response regulator